MGHQVGWIGGMCVSNFHFLIGENTTICSTILFIKGKVCLINLSGYLRGDEYHCKMRTHTRSQPLLSSDNC